MEEEGKSCAAQEAAQLEKALKKRSCGYVEDARLLSRYLRLRGCSQAEAARRLGRSQASVANRLRLLKLPGDVLETLSCSALSERHARALLRLRDAPLQRRALRHIQAAALSVAAAETYVEALLAAPEREFSPASELLREAEALCRSAEGSLRREETEEALVLTIFIKKKQKSPLQKEADMV